MLVDGYCFDGSASLLEGHRLLQTVAGSASWVPTYVPDHSGNAAQFTSY